MKALHDMSQHWVRKRLNMLDVPDDLQGITDIDHAGESTSEAIQLDACARTEIWEACEALYRTGAYPMLGFCLRRNGHMVFNRSIGTIDGEQAATINTPVCLFSASKAISVMLVHRLDEQGDVDLLNPVSHYIPAFAAEGKGDITIQQLLSHRGGVPSVPAGIDPSLLFDHNAALELICAAKPIDPQGYTQAYHAITSGFVINELIKTTTGLDAQQYLNRYFCKPMGMRYMRYGVTKRDRKKVALNVATGPQSKLINAALKRVLGADPNTVVDLTNDPRFYDAILPSANLYGTAEEAGRFFQMLLNGGRWNDTQILEPMTIYRATRAIGPMQLDRTLMAPLRFSAGFMLGNAPVGIYGLNTDQAYGHIGYSNIFCWADPQRDIAVSLVNTGKPVLSSHIKALLGTLHTISSRCAPLAQDSSGG